MNKINSKDMKKILAIAFAAMMSLGTMAQTAQQVLDKTAAVIGNKKGATANFNLSSPCLLYTSDAADETSTV